MLWRTTECVLDGAVVGRRYYDESGTLQMETPLRDGRKHGVEYSWHEGSQSLDLAEPYFDGLIHGTAKQWSRDGTLMGTYTMRHGTGLDLWRHERFDGGPPYLSEVHPSKDGRPHGTEWWLNEDECSVHIERQWCEGELHGIEREWNHHGKLRRGYPRYFIRGTRVDKRAYLRACKTDATLPTFRAEDNTPQRQFPPEIAKHLSRNE